MKTDFPGLVKLLAKHLYPEPDVFIRELVQNAHDSIKLRLAQDSHIAGRIDVFTDSDNRTITFADNGLGMDQYEIEEFLSTIGKTGTGEKTHELAERDVLVETIGQFGIGLLSAFVVAERVDIYTQKLDTQRMWHWSNQGSENYDLEEIPADSQSVGSRVIVIIARKHIHHIKEEAVRKTIKHYADFLPFPIFLNGNGPINVINAPWHTAAWAGERDYLRALHRFLNERYPDHPMHILPIDFASPRAKGVLYIISDRIPDVNTSGVVDIFQKRLCIRLKDQDLLPEWAKFVRGIIDSPDLQPTAGRDNLIKNDAYHHLRTLLGDLIIKGLTDLSAKNPEKFQRLCEWHHYHLKGMALFHRSFFDAVIEYLPFETNEGNMTLKQYVARQSVSAGEKLPVYFFSYGLDSNQFYELCRARRLIAINTGRRFDEELVREYVERRADRLVLKQLDNLDDPKLYESLVDEERKKFFVLEGAVRSALAQVGMGHVQPITRRFVPVDMSGAIIASQNIETFERMESLLNQPFMLEGFSALAEEFTERMRHTPINLFLNADNPLVQKLQSIEDLGVTRYQTLLLGIYNCAILYSQHRMTPENAQVFYRQLHSQMLDILEMEAELRRVKAEKEALQAKIFTSSEGAVGGGVAQVADYHDWVRLFVMMPYEPRYDSLERVLRSILQNPPYCFELVLARDKHINAKGIKNIQSHILAADGYIADVSDYDANVMMEVGWVHFEERLNSRPLMLLFAESKKREFPFDFGDHLRINYVSLPDDEAGERKLKQELRVEFERHGPLQSLIANNHRWFLSPVLFEDFQFLPSDEYKKKICDAFPTVEQLLTADKSEFTRKIRDDRLSKIYEAVVRAFSDQVGSAE